MILLLTIVAGGVIACTAILVALVLADAHREGIERLHDAGEDAPWWLPHDREACGGCPSIPTQRGPSW